MVDESTFPLYRLPFVVLKVALDCLDPHDILRLSMVSKKSYSICKVFRKKVRNLSVRFNSLSDICSACMHTIFSVNSSSEVSPEDSKLESLIVKDTVLQIKMDEYIHLSFYCIDRLACLTILYEYLTDFYEVPLYEVELDGDSITVLNGVLARQETLSHCCLSCSKSGDEEVRWFLDRIENRVTQCLILNVTTSESFRLNLRQPIKTDLICFGSWHTLSFDNFNELNCRGMIVHKTSLTCENLNSYLKKWVIGGGNPNLGCLELRLNSINVDTVLNGIEFIHRHHQNNVYYGFNKGSFSWKFNESYEIKRNDSTIASVIMKNGQNGEFKLCVWPDVFGNVYPEVE
ncbi:unnamed protein product [Caenorhabditis brenneri]